MYHFSAQHSGKEINITRQTQRPNSQTQTNGQKHELKYVLSRRHVPGAGDDRYLGDGT